MRLRPYYPSPFEKSYVLTLDDKGDWKTGGLWLGEGNALRSLEDIYYPDSLGNLYSRVTSLAGFSAGADEHKLQWLSRMGKAELRRAAAAGDTER